MAGSAQFDACRSSLNALAAGVCVVVLMILSLGGCAMFGWAAHVVAGSSSGVEVEGEYLGLADTTVAVVVAADDRTLYRHPQVPQLLSRYVGGRISENMTSVTLIDPGQIAEFQQQNPHWSTLDYGELMNRLQVQRLVVIDIFTYSLHDPENKHVWRGVVAANVNVAESDAANPNTFAYMNTIRAQYPASPVPFLDSDERTIQHGLLQLFSRRTADLFYRHKETRH